MKIGMNVRVMLSENMKRDGIASYTFGLSEAMRRQGHQLAAYYVAFPKRILRAKFNVKIKETIKSQFAAINFCPYISPYKLPKRFSSDIDIYHATDFFCPTFKDGTPVIVTLHDAIGLKHPEWVIHGKRLQRIKQKFMQQLFRRALQSSHHILAVSHAIVADLVNYWGVKEESITVVHPGIDSIWFESPEERVCQSILSQFNLSPGYLLFIGTLQPRKNLHRVIAAFKRLPQSLQRQHPLVIVGQYGWEVDDVMLEINLLNSENKCKWLNYVSSTALRVLYRHAILIVFPSLSEGFGFPILEGFASKTPVLTSNITSMPEVAQEAALLIDPYSVDSIYQGLLDMLTDNTLRQAYVAKGGQRVYDFTWEKSARLTCEVYQKFL